MDYGGLMPPRKPAGMGNFARQQPKGDIVWPLPASTEEVESMRTEEANALAQRMDQAEEAQAAEQWDRSARRQAEVEKLLAAPAPQKQPDPIYHGRRLSEMLRNPASSGTNQLGLSEMLALQQITTGDEPETVTFELPLSYDVVSKAADSFCLLTRQRTMTPMKDAMPDKWSVVARPMAIVF